MAKMIQIRNVPDDVHRKLKVRAASRGMTLSDFLGREAARLAETPTMEEWLKETETRPWSGVSHDEIVQAVREIRGE